VRNGLLLEIKAIENYILRLITEIQLLAATMKQSFITTIILTFLSACSTERNKVVETYPDGKKKVEFVYKEEDDVRGNTLINGQKRRYDSLGNLAQTDNYLKGVLNGEEIWYYPNGKIWMFTKVRNDSAYGFEYEFNENGDTSEADVHYGLSVNGVFRKKWLPNGTTLTASYGDSDRTFVIWKWLDKNGRETKNKIDSGILVDNEYKKFIDPE
jgi:hypothetical protein